MRYLTPDELVDCYGQEVIEDLTDRADPPRGQIDTDRLAEAIEAAEELLEGYLFPRYTLPLSTAPRVLIAHLRSVAFFNLHRNRPNGIADEVRWARDEAEEFFKRVGSGVITLNVRAGQGSEATTAPEPIFAVRPRRFGDDLLEKYR